MAVTQEMKRLALEGTGIEPMAVSRHINTR